MILSMVTRPLASRSKSTTDTRHDTRLLVLTEVDGSMAPLEELDDSTRTRKLARGQFVVKLFDPYYKH
jgi:hypothetical protein